MPGDVATYRESVFLERAIVQERIRLAMGLPLQDLDRPGDGLRRHQEGRRAGDLLRAAAGQRHQVCLQRLRGQRLPRDAQRLPGCLAHPCREICPKGAISFKDKKAFIDHDKCIKCGRCANVCPYHAIHHHVRPAPTRAACTRLALTSTAAQRSTTRSA